MADYDDTLFAIGIALERATRHDRCKYQTDVNCPGITAVSKDRHTTISECRLFLDMNLPCQLALSIRIGEQDSGTNWTTQIRCVRRGVDMVGYR